MLIDFRTAFAKHNIKPWGVIQVGCHWAEEYDELKALGVKEMILIEPCAEAFAKMMAKIDDPNVQLIKCACGSEDSEMEMFVSNNNQGQSNSLLPPLLHLQQHPEVIFTEKEKVAVRKLDNIPFDRSRYNMLLMDVQGYEGEVLKGATETLKHINLIYTECNRGQTYAGNMEIEQMDAFLLPYGFERIETYWPSPNWTWGDCIYKKTAKIIDGNFKES